MKTGKNRDSWWRVVLFGIILAAGSTACQAQSCALCYTQAASAGKRMIEGLRSGILVLVIPPMFMSAGISLLAYKKRNQFHRSDDQPNDQDSW